MNQAEHIISKCGGPHIVAEWLGINVSTVWRWTYPKSKGGTGGLIPACRHVPLIEKAINNEVSLTPDDFFPKVPESIKFIEDHSNDP